MNLRAACLVLTALLDLARGNLEKAQSSAAAVEELIQDHSLAPYWSMWVKTELARFWLEQGKTGQALFLIHDTGVIPDSMRPETLSLNGIALDQPIPYRLIPAYMILMRLFLMLGNSDAVLTLSECMLQEATTCDWGKAATELLVLKALAFQAKKDTSSSLATLESAIALAWSDQSRRVFLDEGEAMGKLLYQARAHGIGGEFVAELLALIDSQAIAVQPSLQNTQEIFIETRGGRSQHLLIEPLSARELEVLRCIADGCSNQEIANRFVLSPLTVKRHISNIYAKLEAKNRTQAVSLARTLKLLD